MNHKKLVTGLLALSLLACPQSPAGLGSIAKAHASLLAAGERALVATNAHLSSVNKSAPIEFFESPRLLGCNALGWALGAKIAQGDFSILDLIKVSVGSVAGSLVASEIMHRSNPHVKNLCEATAVLAHLAGQNAELVARVGTDLYKKGIYQSVEDYGSNFKRSRDAKGLDVLAFVARTFGPLLTSKDSIKQMSKMSRS